jgi:hypothetical protein
VKLRVELSDNQRFRANTGVVTPARRGEVSQKARARGHYAYYEMTGNGRSMASFRHHVERIWRKWLRRRSNAKLPWARFSAFLQRDPLPPVRVVHSVCRHSART